MTDIQRFCAHVVIDPSSGCWLWLGARKRLGYGRFFAGRERRQWDTHRFAYVRFVGPIPKGYHVHHKCENPPCCNPSHLEPLTRQAHLAATPRWPGNWTHCKHGHPLSGNNLVPSMLPVRTCRTCWNIRAAATAARRKADPERAAERREYDRDWKRKRKEHG